MHTAYQMNEARCSKPNTDENAGELCEADAVGSAQQAQVLKDVRERHQAECSEKSQTCKQKHKSITVKGVICCYLQ